MKLLFARHGETDWNVAMKIQGSTDIPLNENGRKQARELAKRIQALGLTDLALFTSPQRRARETAEIVAKLNGAPCSPRNGLEEINFGKWEGRSWAEIQETFPDEYEQWKADKRFDKSHSGESYEEMLRRVWSAVKSIAEMAGRTPLIISHGGVILALQCVATGTPFSEMHTLRFGNTELIEIESDILMEKLS